MREFMEILSEASVEKINDGYGSTISFYFDPSIETIKNITASDHYKKLRGFSDGATTVFWSAYKTTHWAAFESLKRQGLFDQTTKFPMMTLFAITEVEEGHYPEGFHHRVTIGDESLYLWYSPNLDMVEHLRSFKRLLPR